MLRTTGPCTVMGVKSRAITIDKGGILNIMSIGRVNQVLDHCHTSRETLYRIRWNQFTGEPASHIPRQFIIRYWN